MKIRVHSYESLGTFDGPGLRLVVFLQGCNFRCLYCANPDTIDCKGESKETDIEDIVRMAMNEKPFFGKRGGVTFSGGEPTFQAKALIPLVKRLKEQGIHVCIDTNGGIWNSDVEELFSLTSPVSGVSKPPMMRSVVVLPQPEGPSRVRNSFLRMYRSMPLRTVTPSYSLLTPIRSIR